MGRVSLTITVNCEIKFRKKVEVQVIAEVQAKIQKLKIPKHLSVRPVLIYAGDLGEQVKESEFFDRLIGFEDLLN